MALTTVRPEGMGFNTGRRNLVINGAMQVAQRGTSNTGVTSGGYKEAPDRWNIAMSSAGTWTVSQSTTVPSGEGFSHSYKFDCTTADASLSAGDHLVLAHYIEAQNVAHLCYGTASAKKLTLSFWVRSAKTGTYVLELLRNDDSRHIAQTYTISSADTWERKTLTFDGDTGGSAIPHDNGRGFEVNFWLAAGSTFSGGTLATSWASTTAANRAVGVLNLADSTSNDWYVTGVQLEVGENASDFEHRSFGEEMALCQRYFHRTTGSTYTPHGGGAVFDADTSDIHVHLPQAMGTSPSLSFGGNVRVSRGSALTTDVIAVTNATGTSSSNPCVAWLRADHGSGYNTGDAVYCFNDNDATGHVSYDAEL